MEVRTLFGLAYKFTRFTPLDNLGINPTAPNLFARISLIDKADKADTAASTGPVTIIRLERDLHPLLARTDFVNFCLTLVSLRNHRNALCTTEKRLYKMKQSC